MIEQYFDQLKGAHCTQKLVTELTGQHCLAGVNAQPYFLCTYLRRIGKMIWNF